MRIFVSSSPQHSIKHTRGSRDRGFTLIEALLVVTLIGILISIAMPNYESYIRRSHRANAKAALMNASLWLERAATAAGHYPAASNIPTGVLLVEGGRYTNVVKASAPNATNPDVASHSFWISTHPLGPQARDECGSFSITNTGIRGVTPPGGRLQQGDAPLVLLCWSS